MTGIFYIRGFFFVISNPTATDIYSQGGFDHVGNHQQKDQGRRYNLTSVIPTHWATIIIFA